MNLNENYTRYHFDYLYNMCCCPQFSHKFFYYWKLYQIKINEKIYGDFYIKPNEISIIENIMNMDEIMENMINLMLKKSIEYDKFTDLFKNFKKLSTYNNILYSDHYILKIYKFKIGSYPYLFEKDLINCIDVHNEGFIQYLLFLNTPKKICKKCIPFISYVIYSVDNSKNDLYTGIYMQKIEGLEFSRILMQNNPKRIVKIILKIIDIIEYYQKKLNFLHNDLKPNNIIVDKDDNIYLIDFGLSYIYYMDNHIYPTCLDGLCLDKNLNEKKDYEFNFYEYVNFEYRHQSDIIYLLMHMLYYLKDDNPLYEWITNIFLKYNNINIYEYIKNSGLKYFEFVLSKDKKIFEYHFPSINSDIFYSNFELSIVKYELNYLLKKIERIENSNQNQNINQQYLENNNNNTNKELNNNNELINNETILFSKKNIEFFNTLFGII